MLPEVAFERFLHEKHERKETTYSHISGRVAVEDLPPNHLYRWFADWMNQQLSDIGVNSTGGVTLPPLHFELVRADGGKATAHTFESNEWGFIVLTQPMFDEMTRLSHLLVDQNRAFFALQIAPGAPAHEIAQLLLLMQFCFVTSHEYSHLVRQHLADQPPEVAALGEALWQAQELDADGYGIYHDLAYFFNGAGKVLAGQWLTISGVRALENSTLSCFLLAVMIQFCARWAGKMQIESDFGAEHPPLPVRIEFAILFIDMWCREVGGLSTSWMKDGTLVQYFNMAARLFPPGQRVSWDQQMSWLRSPHSEQYRAQIRMAIDRLRTGRTESLTPTNVPASKS